MFPFIVINNKIVYTQTSVHVKVPRNNNNFLAGLTSLAERPILINFSHPRQYQPTPKFIETQPTSYTI